MKTVQVVVMVLASAIAIAGGALLHATKTDRAPRTSEAVEPGSNAVKAGRADGDARAEIARLRREIAALKARIATLEAAATPRPAGP
jgi:ubiquinone biosynthesis protein UbiJ